MYDEVFGERRSRSEARRFRRRGLARHGRRVLAAFAAQVPLAGATVLEIGAGIGALSLTLLDHGAARATLVDASPAAVFIARELAEERRVAGRLEAEVGDFANRRGEERYDVVILDRVVCCYPDWRALLAPAAAAARGALVLAYPRDVWYMRFLRRVINGGMALLGKEFRFYLHPPAALHALLAEAGLRPRVVERGGVWALVVARRG